MPIITHEDQILLARLDIEVAELFEKSAKQMKKISKQEIKIADSYQDYSKILSEYVRKMRDKKKQIDVLSREKDTGLTDVDVKEYLKEVQRVDDQIKMIDGYYDRMKDLAIQKKGIIKRISEYKKLVHVNAKIRKNIVTIGLKIEKEKNKMVAADSISGTESKLKDTQREFDRSNKEIKKKWAQIEEERKEINTMWQAYKNSIENFAG